MGFHWRRHPGSYIWLRLRDRVAPTVIETVPAPPPPAGSAIGKWSGTGNEVTPAFSAPASGDYIVS
jgi:hypothetical protein